MRTDFMMQCFTRWIRSSATLPPTPKDPTVSLQPYSLMLNVHTISPSSFASLDHLSTALAL